MVLRTIFVLRYHEWFSLNSFSAAFDEEQIRSQLLGELRRLLC